MTTSGAWGVGLLAMLQMLASARGQSFIMPNRGTTRGGLVSIMGVLMMSIIGKNDVNNG